MRDPIRDPLANEAEPGASYRPWVRLLVGEGTRRMAQPADRQGALQGDARRERLRRVQQLEVLYLRTRRRAKRRRKRPLVTAADAQG